MAGRTGMPLWRTVELPGGGNYTLVIGEVVALYIDDRFVRDA